LKRLYQHSFSPITQCKCRRTLDLFRFKRPFFNFLLAPHSHVYSENLPHPHCLVHSYVSAATTQTVPLPGVILYSRQKIHKLICYSSWVLPYVQFVIELFSLSSSESSSVYSVQVFFFKRIHINALISVKTFGYLLFCMSSIWISHGCMCLPSKCHYDDDSEDDNENSSITNWTYGNTQFRAVRMAIVSTIRIIVLRTIHTILSTSSSSNALLFQYQIKNPEFILTRNGLYLFMNKLTNV
jgi:hypothetical protein